jgi:hypothetical protein
MRVDFMAFWMVQVLRAGAESTSKLLKSGLKEGIHDF